MSRRTLPDELRSVLLARALQAPDADETVRRVLASTATGEPEPPASGHPRWPGSRWLLVAAAVLLVGTVAALGVVAAGQQHSDRRTASSRVTGSAAVGGTAASPAPSGSGAGPSSGMVGRMGMAPGAMAGGTAPVPGNPPTPPGLDCATLPGSRPSVGASTTVEVPGGRIGYLYEFRCLTGSGQRSASTVAGYTGGGVALTLRAVLLPASAGAQLDFLAGAGNTVVIQSVSRDGTLVRQQFSTDDLVRYRQDSDLVVGRTCTAAEVTATVQPAAAVPPGSGRQPYAVLLTKQTGGVCVVSGYPGISSGGVAARPTLRGPAGGTGGSVPEIVQLARGETVAALIEPGSGCRPSRTASVTLPDGSPLGTLAAGLPLCGAQVHPFVPNDRGSD